MADQPLGDDWRLMGQERFLNGVTLYFRTWRTSRPAWDHDHCAFCGEKFSDTIPDTLREGYATADQYHWVCVRCFADFRQTFEWTVGTAP